MAKMTPDETIDYLMVIGRDRSSRSSDAVDAAIPAIKHLKAEVDRLHAETVRLNAWRKMDQEAMARKNREADQIADERNAARAEVDRLKGEIAEAMDRLERRGVVPDCDEDDDTLVARITMICDQEAWARQERDDISEHVTRTNRYGREAERDLDEARAEVERLGRDVVEYRKLRDEWHRKAIEATACQGTARPRPRPDREALAKSVFRAGRSGEEYPDAELETHWGALPDALKDWCLRAADAVAAALDAAPLPTGTGRPDDGEPLLCPFCGRKPQFTERGACRSEGSPTGQIFFLACMCGGYSARAHQFGYSREEVIAAWNQRYVAAALDAAPLPTGAGRPAVIDDTKRLDWVERYEIDLTHCDMGWLGVGPESMTWASDFLPTIREVIDQGIDDHPGTLSAPSEATS